MRVILLIKILTAIIIKCRLKYVTLTSTNTELLVILDNDRKFLGNIKKSSPSDAVMTLYTSLKRLIHRLT